MSYGPGLTPLGSATIGTPVQTVTFSSIPATFSHLQLIALMRSDTANFSSGVRIILNGDVTTGHYAYSTFWSSKAGTITVDNVVSDVSISSGQVPAASTTSAIFVATVVIFIPNYTGTSFMKNLWFYCNPLWGAQGNAHFYTGAGVWFPASATAINSINFGPENGNMVTNSKMALYGID